MIPRLARANVLVEAPQYGYGSSDVDFLGLLISNYSEIRIKMGAKFAFRPPRTVVIGPVEPSWRLLMLHEVGHALCKHKDFRMDVERLKMEVQAWEKAKELAQRYEVEIDEDLIQDELDTYRDWLHQKSRCPKCGLTRFQTPDSQYHCPLCEDFAKS